MLLLGSPGSPFVRKVRVVAHEKGIPIDYVVERASAPGSRVPQFNPLGKIPVLIPDGGEPVYDSVVIAEYFDGLKAEPRLIPADFAGRIAVKRWEALADGMAETAVFIDHDYGPMTDVGKRPDWNARQHARIVRALDTLERAVAERTWLHADAFSLADICAGYALYYLDQVMADIGWRTGHPRLARYAERLFARASFRDTVPVTA